MQTGCSISHRAIRLRDLEILVRAALSAAGLIPLACHSRGQGSSDHAKRISTVLPPLRSPGELFGLSPIKDIPRRLFKPTTSRTGYVSLHVFYGRPAWTAVISETQLYPRGSPIRCLGAERTTAPPRIRCACAIPKARSWLHYPRSMRRFFSLKMCRSRTREMQCGHGTAWIRTQPCFSLADGYNSASVYAGDTRAFMREWRNWQTRWI